MCWLCLTSVSVTNFVNPPMSGMKKSTSSELGNVATARPSRFVALHARRPELSGSASTVSSSARQSSSCVAAQPHAGALGEIVVPSKPALYRVERHVTDVCQGGPVDLRSQARASASRCAGRSAGKDSIRVRTYPCCGAWHHGWGLGRLIWITPEVSRDRLDRSRERTAGQSPA